MKTIAIMNVKGGVGKTVTAVNLAEILAGEHGKRVLLIDCDAQGDATYLLGAEDGNVSTYELLTQSGTIDWMDPETVTPSRYRGLDVIPACSDLYYLQAANPEDMIRRVEEALGLLDREDRYDWVIFDCPPSFSAPAIAALCSSDYVTVPLAMAALDIRGCNNLMAQLEAVHDLSSMRLTDVRALPTMVHPGEVCKQALELLEETGIPLWKSRIRRTDKVPESTFYAQSILEYSPQSWAGRDYRNFVAELLARTSGEEAQRDEL